VDGQASGAFRHDLNPTTAAKMFFGALDEMATNWILSRRRYLLEADAEPVVDLFLSGARAR
jgi:TetR/AcrR family fatty acid metabolism transcriptional regulator